MKSADYLLNNYSNTALYFGIKVINYNKEKFDNDYKDIEKFVLDSTLYAKSSRSTEGILTWLKTYGRIVSPSKLRRLVLNGYECDTAVLGAYLDFINLHHSVNFTIVRSVCKKRSKPESLNAMIPKSVYKIPNPIFIKWGLLAPNFICEDKFLESPRTLLKRCVELRNRIVMGSVVHSDIASLLERTKEKLSNYEIAKRVNHFRGSVNKALENYPDRNS